LCQVTKDIDEAENFLKDVNVKPDFDSFGTDAGQLVAKLAEEEV